MAIFSMAGDAPAALVRDIKAATAYMSMMPVNNEIKKQIVKSRRCGTAPSALGKGMISLLAHGGELVKQGMTTVAEVLRVTVESRRGISAMPLYHYQALDALGKSKKGFIEAHE